MSQQQAMTTTDDVSVTSLRNIFTAFLYWPRVFKLLWTTSPGYLISIIGLAAVAGLLPTLILLAQQTWINSITGIGSHPLSTLIWTSLLFAGASFLSLGSSTVRANLEALFENRLTNRINVMVMEKVTTLSLADFEKAEIQDQLKRVQGDAASRPYVVVARMLAVLTSAITLVTSAAMLATWKWWAVLVVLAVPVLSFFYYLRLGQFEFLRSFERAPKSRAAWYLTYLLTRDNSFKEVKLYQFGSYLVRRYQSLYDFFYKEDKQLVVLRTMAMNLFGLISMLTGLLLIVLLAQDTIGRLITIGAVVSLIQAIRLTESTTLSLMQSLLSLCQNNLFLMQLFGFLDLETAESAEGAEARLDVPEIESIEFRNVTFRYPGTQQDALRDVSFTVRRGEMLAIVGRNGSGKSTLVKLLSRLYQGYEGEILLNGLPIRQYDRHGLMKKIGVVFQDFVQYEMPLRQNVGFGRIESIDDDAHLHEALHRAGIAPLIDKLPDGLDTHLGRWIQEGVQFSGGQWQRVAIARAFLRQADLYVLDEPSSFLDPRSEKEVFDMFRELTQNRIGMYISHRYSSVGFSDKILVLDQGQVMEHGSHQELMGQNGVYAELYRLQMSSFFAETEEKESQTVSAM